MCDEESGFLVLLDLIGHLCLNEVMRSWNRSGRGLLGPGVVASMRHGCRRSDKAKGEQMANGRWAGRGAREASCQRGWVILGPWRWG